MPHSKMVRIFIACILTDSFFYFNFFLDFFAGSISITEFSQADGEQPSTSRNLDDDDYEPDDLSAPLSSTGTEKPGI